jgi:hypothetical protein
MAMVNQGPPEAVKKLYTAPPATLPADNPAGFMAEELTQSLMEWNPLIATIMMQADFSAPLAE